MAVLSLTQWKLLLVLVCASQVVSADTIVCLRSNNKLCIQGVNKVTSLTIEYEAFVGIPYAKPPVGQLRFANPVPKDPWTGVYNATLPKPACIQRNELLPQLGSVVGQEDCLYLNVYRPKNAGRNLPVMIYIHGGEFQWGFADQSLSGPDRLMNSREVILVTVAYRLGALGFLSTGDSEAPGNFGLKDQSMAIRWVSKHIRMFGGDSKLITLFGDSSGAAATQYHMMSPLSRGHFSRAIMMGGSALALYARPTSNPLRIARLQAGVLGLTPYDTLTSSKVITYLRNISAEQLVGSFDSLKQMEGLARSITIYRPVIEQYVAGQSFLHESPLTLWASGNYEQIPWMIGHVPNEGIIFSRDLLRPSMDSTQWSDLITNAPSMISQILELDLFKVIPGVQYSFGEINLMVLPTKYVISLWTNNSGACPKTTLSHFDKFLTRHRIPQLLTVVQFEYPMLKSISQHLKHASLHKAPVSVYSMNFAGPYSLSSITMPGSTDPIVYTDDLQYVLNRPLLFPDFEFGSPGHLMATKMVKLFVEFARTGQTLSSHLGTCTSEVHCKQIEFSNGLAGFDPVRVELTNGTDFEVLKLWDDLYSKASIVEADIMRML